MMITTFVKHLQWKHKHHKQALTNQVTAEHSCWRHLLAAGRVEVIFALEQG
jgi:hypothetical protein